MAKFKAGDRVVARDDDDDQGTVTEFDGDLYAVHWDSHGTKPDNKPLWDESELRLVKFPSPIRTITRREIASTTVDIGAAWLFVSDRRPDGSIAVDLNGSMKAANLREAARIFTEIADVLDENAKAAA